MPTRSPASPRSAPRLPDRSELERLKLSPEVAHYLLSRGIPLPTCPPLVKTPEPGELLPSARFDPERVDRVLTAFSLLRHTQGEWAGRPLKPDPWQVAYIIAPVFGWVRKNSRGMWMRVIRELYVDVPRKNGKSTLCGGLAIYLTCADGEPGAQVLSAATTKRQAGFVFSPVKQLAEHSPALKPHVTPYATKIIHKATGSYFEVVSSIADAQHGANVHGAVVDELHVHKSAELVEAIESGTGSRRQPLVAFITTADDGRPDTIYERKRKRVEQLARRVFRHPSTYGVVFAAAKDVDPFSEVAWRDANPGYGISPTKEYLETAAAEARQSPANLSKFLRLHLGIRTKQQTRYVPLDAWDASAGVVDEATLAGRKAYGGLDLASVEDVTALAWEFPGEGGSVDAVWRFWLPEERLEDVSRRTAGEAQVWLRDGHLRLTPGNVIDLDFIREQVLADAERFSVQTIGYDRWGASPLVTKLEEEGLTCVPRGQGFASASAPLKDLLRLTLIRQLRHGGNPVMRWMTDNLTVRMDPSGNVKPDKAVASDKIDGWSALVTAHGELMDNARVEEPAPLPAAPRRSHVDRLPDHRRQSARTRGRDVDVATANF